MNSTIQRSPSNQAPRDGSKSVSWTPKGRSSISSPRRRRGWEAFRNSSMTWTTGLRSAARSGASSRTRRSNERSAWAKASSTTSRVSRSRARASVRSSTRTRTTRVLIKQPITSFMVGSRKLAGAPRSTSRRPVRRWSSTQKSAVQVMNGVVSVSRESALRRVLSRGERAWRTVCARRLAPCVRGRSVGKRSVAGAPASSSRHQAGSAFSAWSRSSRDRMRSAG